MLGACTVDEHGLAVGLIGDSCTPAGDTGQICSQVVQAVVQECLNDCMSCDADHVIASTGTCLLPTHELASEVVSTACQTQVVAAAPPPPGPCSVFQQTVINQCASDCSGCNYADVDNSITGCILSGRAQHAGATFCRHGGGCTELQHVLMGRCMSNCDDCNMEATSTVLGDCAVDTDTAQGGARANDILQAECATGDPCSGLQQATAARCMQNCDACDREATATVLGSCTEDGHGHANGMIEDTCAASEPPPPSPGAAPPPPPPPPPQCSMLQLAVMNECRDDCGVCRVETVRTILGDCVLDTGSLARDNMCAHVAVVTHQAGVCSGLQQAVLQSCSNDCSGCKQTDVATVLAGCTIDGAAQEPGVTFCVAGTPCSQLQHGVLARCLSNCEACGVEATSTVLGDCVVDNGVRAVDMITTECDMGQPCSGIQTAIAARCFADCSACDLVATGTVVGACTETGHGSIVTELKTGAADPYKVRSPIVPAFSWLWQVNVPMTVDNAMLPMCSLLLVTACPVVSRHGQA